MKQENKYEKVVEWDYAPNYLNYIIGFIIYFNGIVLFATSCLFFPKPIFYVTFLSGMNNITFGCLLVIINMGIIKKIYFRRIK